MPTNNQREATKTTVPRESCQKITSNKIRICQPLPQKTSSGSIWKPVYYLVTIGFSCRFKVNLVDWLVYNYFPKLPCLGKVKIGFSFPVASFLTFLELVVIINWISSILSGCFSIDCFRCNATDGLRVSIWVAVLSRATFVAISPAFTIPE